MKLPVSQMKEGENLYRYESEKESWLKDVMTHVKTEGVELSGPLSVDLNFTKLEPDYYLRGELKYSLQQPCSRCAELVKRDIAHHFELALSHVGTTRPAVTEKLAEESEEVDVIIFYGPEIVLDPMIEEQVILSVPYLSLCKDDCKGICQKCGKNLNEGACRCANQSAEKPFSVLKNFKH